MKNLHPYFVHFPIALLFVSVLFDLLSVLFSRESLRNAGWWCLLFGVIGAIGAVATGLYAEGGMSHTHGGTVAEVLSQHKTAQLIVSGLFVLLLVWRTYLQTELPDLAAARWAYLLLGVFGAAVMGYGAHLGGRLVYEFGEGTSIERPPEPSSQPETDAHEHDHGQDHGGNAGDEHDHR